ncbi:MAG: hypothetical protein KAU48_01460, partial [Candidatus Thorarchaeota archaeon]|nr:hypothetical protein [Candidatus Thorarchaeota archaeon]
MGLNYGDGVYYNSYPSGDMLGLNNFTLRFTYFSEGSELSAKIKTPNYGQIGVASIINASVYNLGTVDETDVSIYIYLEGVIVSSSIIPILYSGENATMTYDWTPTSDGIFNFTVYVEPVLDEFSISNNRMTRFASVYSGLPFAVFYDYLPWGFNSTCEILTDNGIPYVILGSSDMGIVDLSGYQKVIISSVQSTAFMNRIYANLTWFEAYAEGGGILEIHAADWNPWVNGEVPGGVTYVSTGEDVVNIVDPYHQMVLYPNEITDAELDYWDSSVHGHLEDVSPTASVIIETISEYPALIEFGYGTGFILVSSQTLEFGFGNGYSRILENILLYCPERYEHDVSVYLDVPNVVYPGEEVLLNVTVMNIGLNSETDLQFGLRINGSEIYAGTIAFLENGTMYEESIPWIEYVSGIYEVTAYVEEVTGEIDIDNNEFARWLRVSSITRVLWDQGHGSWPLAYHAFFIGELEYHGYIVETTTEPLNNIDLTMYSALVLPSPMVVYSIEEQDAIEAFVMAGGGLLAISTYVGYLNDITDFAGIGWLDQSIACNSTDIAVHEVTQDVGSVYFYAPWTILNVTEPAVILVNDTSSNPLVAASEIGLGRVVAIGDPGVLHSEPGLELILMSDNLVLGINSMNWLTHAASSTNITDIQQVPTVVAYMDGAVVTCDVTDSYGIESVELVYRV